MQFNCGPTYTQKRKHKEQWHRHYIIFPRRMGDEAEKYWDDKGTDDCRWMEWVERKGTYSEGPPGASCWMYQYRAIIPKEEGSNIERWQQWVKSKRHVRTESELKI